MVCLLVQKMYSKIAQKRWFSELRHAQIDVRVPKNIFHVGSQKISYSILGLHAYLIGRLDVAFILFNVSKYIIYTTVFLWLSVHLYELSITYVGTIPIYGSTNLLVTFQLPSCKYSPYHAWPHSAPGQLREHCPEDQGEKQQVCSHQERWLVYKGENEDQAGLEQVSCLNQIERFPHTMF